MPLLLKNVMNIFLILLNILTHDFNSHLVFQNKGIHNLFNQTHMLGLLKIPEGRSLVRFTVLETESPSPSVGGCGSVPVILSPWQRGRANQSTLLKNPSRDWGDNLWAEHTHEHTHTVLFFHNVI